MFVTIFIWVERDPCPYSSDSWINTQYYALPPGEQLLVLSGLLASLLKVQVMLAAQEYMSALRECARYYWINYNVNPLDPLFSFEYTDKNDICAFAIGVLEFYLHWRIDVYSWLSVYVITREPEPLKMTANYLKCVMANILFKTLLNTNWKWWVLFTFSFILYYFWYSLSCIFSSCFCFFLSFILYYLRWSLSSIFLKSLPVCFSSSFVKTLRTLQTLLAVLAFYYFS